MGIPITGTRKAMVTKLKAKGFTEKIQENDVGVELKGKYLGKDVLLEDGGVINPIGSQTQRAVVR